MLQRALPFLVSTALGFAVVACTAGSTTTVLSGTGSPNGSATSPTDPAGDGKDGTLGAACTEYVACCADLSDKVPRLAMSCDATKKQLENAEANGTSTSIFESACQSGVDAFKNAGYCTKTSSNPSPSPPKKCVASCTQDADCANSCPAISGAVACCDLNTRSCFASKSPACPKPDPAPPDPPPSY